MAQTSREADLEIIHDDLRVIYEGQPSEQAPIDASLAAHLGHVSSQVVDLVAYEQDKAADELAKELADAEVLSRIGDRKLAEIDALHAAVVAKQTKQREARAGIVEASTQVDGVEVVRRLKAHGVVKIAPTLKEQVKDPTRLATFAYQRKCRPGEAPVLEHMTEAEGLKELHGFLQAAIEKGITTPPSAVRELERVRQARGMLEGLTFIGSPEFQEAAAGLAAYWKGYLGSDPRNVLCLTADIGKLDRYAKLGIRKSDDKLRDFILSSFSDEELQRYSGRIVASPDDVSVEPQFAKVVILDDWSMSGRALRDTYKRLRHTTSLQEFVDARKVEINFLVASRERIRKGMVVRSARSGEPETRLPVRAYYRSHKVYTASEAQEGHVTGRHSVVNIDFQDPVELMARSLLGDKRAVPALASVVAENARPGVVIAPDSLTRTSLRKQRRTRKK
ncbi:MAG: hypothetical protein JWM81_670 [Candidatus Saccharibacteria bacterium]|nr:hypothetical protein [Candidatus Saccharibacteria bacterium]